MIRFPVTTIGCAVLALTALGIAQNGTKDTGTGRLNLATTGAEPARLPSFGAPGAKPEERPKGPTEITARDAMFDNRIHMGTFSGDVVVTDPEFGLSCGHLSVYLKKPKDKTAATKDPAPANAKAPGEASSGIEKAVAEGSVVITQDKIDGDGKPQRYTGRAEQAVFDNDKGTLTLSGWPQISQSISGSVSKQITAREKSCVIILNRAGKIEVKGYHSSTILDPETLNQKTPAAQNPR
jgi:lipopolysaccharide export system protein LptA